MMVPSHNAYRSIGKHELHVMQKSIWLSAALSIVSALAGCATNSTPPLYQWTGYEPQVYEYFKGTSAPQAQIQALENALEKIRAKGEVPPPGFYAHLGMLYASTEKYQQAEEAFAAEKQLFPESSTYMDFMLKKPRNDINR
jgi:hypothetical protein